MITQQQRIQIAEACGYVPVPRNHYWTKDESWWNRPNGGHACERAELPDYGDDLNACHEMEKTLNAVQQIRYAKLLHKPHDSQRHYLHAEFDVLHATAEQRCLAFLEVINTDRLAELTALSVKRGLSSVEDEELTRLKSEERP
jgi:hypothetical protein